MKINCGFIPGITSQVGAELPVDSDDAAYENRSKNGNSLLFVFERGYYTCIFFAHIVPI
jgi:hypothetical protein